MEVRQVCIIGIGLIGGSFAIKLRNKKLASRIVGVETNCEHKMKALELQIVDEVLELEEAVSLSDLVVLTTPVDKMIELLPSVLNMVDRQVVMDMGSTKGQLLEAIRNHPKRGRYVATHPLWGTEHSGPQAAIGRGAFKNRFAVICNACESDADAISFVRWIYGKIGMRRLEVEAFEHDLHVAYVSHISHITSFALANTVLEKEKEENTIFQLASGGFESTVRLAKSASSMWVPIFMQNRENILDVLNEHITQLRKFKSCLEKENYVYLGELIENANRIRKILK